MSPKTAGAGGGISQTTLREAREAISERMQKRRGEIEQAVLVRAAALLEATDSLDPQFLDGQRAAVSAAVEYGLAAIELGEERTLEVPALLHSHARLTARSGVSLETMLRRYFAGYTLLSDFLVREAEDFGLQRTVLQSLMRDTATVFERLIATMTDEYMREANDRPSSADQRMVARTRALLAGELLDTAEFGYEFDGWHLAALVIGKGSSAALRELSALLDRRLLLVRDGQGPIWAWFGGRREFDWDEVERILCSSIPEGISIALGEPAPGLSGWRLSHRQACAVLPIILRGQEHYARYADVALLASMLQDDLLAASLREMYLAPLEMERDGGKILRETLRAYFIADRNASSAAAALGVSRRTVANRLRVIESLIDRSLSSCAAEIEAALRLHDLNDISPEAIVSAALQR